MSSPSSAAAPSSPPTSQPSRHAHSHSHSHASPQPPRTATGVFRASVDAGGTANGGRGWASSPRGPSNSARPASELLAATSGGGSIPGAFASAETEAIDRWFEDLQHYEATLEEMAAASLDANFKEELSAIEQWFRVLSEAERTAALYSLLQSSTQVQMRFFVTVLQQMARNDPLASGLMSPAAVGQQSMESQMEAKLNSFSFKSPPSPGRPHSSGRQSLGPYSASAQPPSTETFLSPNSAATPSPAEELASQRAKLKASARTSAPANLLLGASAGATGTGAGGVALWSEKERLIERSPSPSERPKSTGSSDGGRNQLSQSTGPASSSAPYRSPGATAALNERSASLDYENQLSPLVGGSWASMVNTPLVPMFGSAKPGDDYGASNFGALSSPGLDGASARLGSWQASNPNNSTSNNSNGGGGIVLDDVRKFRRSARVSGSGAPAGGGVNGGALGGMYDERAQMDQQRQHEQQQQQQRRQQGQGQGQGQYNNNNQGMHQQQQYPNSAQQNAINLGLGGLPATPARQHHQSNNQSHLQNLAAQLPPLGSSSPGGLLAQQAAVAAQANWRNGLGSPTGLQNHHGGHHQGSPHDHLDQYGQGGGQNNLPGGGFGHNSPASANVQLANLFALQQQMQLQQLQMAHASGIALTPVQMMGLQQQQSMLSPNSRMMGMGGMNGMGGMGMGGMGGMGNMGGMGMGGMSSPRRSPRSADRSPGGNNSSSKTNMPSAAGSGSNPDEAIDLSLLSDIPAWLRSLRLHKYTPNFEHSHWKEMVMLDDQGLEGKGVGALGARRKLLKVFETVRGKMGMPAMPGDGGHGSAKDAGSVRSSSPTASATGGDRDP